MKNSFWTFAAVWLLLSGPVAAQEVASEDNSAEAVAKKLADPNASMGFLSVPIDYIEYTGDAPGATRQSAWKVGFQPSAPYSLGEGVNLFVRPLVPLVIDQPLPAVADQPIDVYPPESQFQGSGVELGDISFDVAIGKTFSNNMVLFAGVVGTMPTATSDDIGLDQWLFGPEIYVGKNTSFGHMGVLLTQQWDVAGEDDFDTSITGGQYFFTYNLENAWQIQMSPTFSYNHEAESGEELTFPLGIGLSKTQVFDKTPVKFNLQYWHYLEAPSNFGPDWQVRLTVTPVVPLPW